MSKMKLRGTSTVEAIMAMILSGIILSAISAGLLFVVKSYDAYNKANSTIDEQLLFSAAMNKDFINCNYITANGNLLSFFSNKNNTYTYEFNPGNILKRTNERTDTFHIPYINYQCFMNGENIYDKESLISEFKLTTEENKFLFFSKIYAADVLIEHELKKSRNGI